MNAAAEARLSELDRALDAQELSQALAAELFAVADLLAGGAPLRNALSDPTVPDDRRRELATGVLSGRVSAGALAVAGEAAALKWGSATSLVAAIDRQGIRALLGHAQVAGELDAVEDELFRFGRSVAASSELRQALDDRSLPVADRQQLVTDLIQDKVRAETIDLARRAVTDDGRPFDVTVANYLKLAAAARQRAIATVTVARALPIDQKQRLQAALVRQLGRQVNLQIVVDPGVIGGARVQVGDEVIEGTVAGKLAAAVQQLS
jgi:F-type H+-transporting ATPase subunit delta